MPIWRRAGRPRGHPIRADPATRVAGDVLDLGRAGRSARQPLAHTGRVAARSRGVDGVRTGATATGHRPLRTGTSGRRRRRTEPDAQSCTGRATPRGAAARSAARPAAAAGDQADARIATAPRRQQATPQPTEADAAQTRRDRSRAIAPWGVVPLVEWPGGHAARIETSCARRNEFQHPVTSCTPSRGATFARLGWNRVRERADGCDDLFQ
jgi:hypothetical protein